jgi:hypothetical protein
MENQTREYIGKGKEQEKEGATTGRSALRDAGNMQSNYTAKIRTKHIAPSRTFFDVVQIEENGRYSYT